MKRVLKVSVIAALLAFVFALPAFAGEGAWKQSGNRWWWQRTDSSYMKDGGAWIDGNGDGIYE